MTRYRLDTNVVLRFVNPLDLQYDLVTDAVFRLRAQGHQCVITAQILIRPFQKFTSVTAPGFEGDLTRIVAERNLAGLRQFLSEMNHQD